MKLAIDAIHMVALAKKDPKEQIGWNLKGIALAEADTNSRSWLWALYNNIGDCYLGMEDYENARLYFHKLVELQKEKGGEPDMYTLKDEARAIRLSGHPAEAFTIIELIFSKLQKEKQDDGWIREELAENLYALGKKKGARQHFIIAYELLSKEDFCIKNEQEKLNHLKEMAE
jgi:tetratricopeptide (TPR) repeat protein